uniref:Uncharacterized protein n=1 Tax=Anguilla anguilla TaxID=7936 RepID=A0A0E9WWB4_ANGAN
MGHQHPVASESCFRPPNTAVGTLFCSSCTSSGSPPSSSSSSSSSSMSISSGLACFASSASSLREVSLLTKRILSLGGACPALPRLPAVEPSAPASSYHQLHSALEQGLTPCRWRWRWP